MHEVGRGDTLYQIAREKLCLEDGETNAELGLFVRATAKLNGIKADALLNPGDAIMLPPVEITVSPGQVDMDTLFDIYGLSDYIVAPDLTVVDDVKKDTNPLPQLLEYSFVEDNAKSVDVVDEFEVHGQSFDAVQEIKKLKSEFQSKTTSQQSSLQAFLSLMGYPCSIDGDYGPNTEAALIDLCRDYQLNLSSLETLYFDIGALASVELSEELNVFGREQFAQNGPEGDYMYANKRHTLRRSGCLLTALANGLTNEERAEAMQEIGANDFSLKNFDRYLKTKTKAFEGTNLNIQTFAQSLGFVYDDDLRWSGMRGHKWVAETLHAIQRGDLVLAQVSDGQGSHHFVRVTGLSMDDEGELGIEFEDPVSQDRQNPTLSTFKIDARGRAIAPKESTGQKLRYRALNFRFLRRD